MIIKYVTNVRIPTPRAQGYAIMKMCSEFSVAGVNVELFVPDRTNNDSDKDPFDFYKIKGDFKINKIPGFDFLGRTLKFGRLFYWIDMFIFLVMSKFIIKIGKEDVIYTRDFLTILSFSKNKFIVVELHEIPSNKFLFNLVLKNVKLFFVLNRYLKDTLVTMGVDELKIHISPSGVELKEFDIPLEKEEARKKLNLPIQKKIIMYSGQFYKWKGVDVLAKTASLLPDVNFVFVGGVEPEFSEFELKYGKLDNVIIKPFQEREMIPIFLKASDILVLPNSALEKISTHYTSPLKLFEYMVAKRPMVVSDLPSMREVLNEKLCAFALPDDPKSFAKAIKEVLSNNEVAKEIAENAYSKVKQYSWDKRAKSIIDVINAAKNTKV